MEIKYEMHLGNLHTLRKVNEMTDVVVAIEYTYSGSTVIDGFGYAHGITRAATVLKNVEDINGDNIIDFNDISRDTALEWVNATLSEFDILSMQNTIKSHIENQSVYAVKTAPWIRIYVPDAPPQDTQPLNYKE
jgi:hypothetical protein